MEELFVNMGQINALKSKGILTTVGLGSCVGVTLYDKKAKVGVMGHIFLPKSRGTAASENAPAGKYANTGIPAMIEKAVQLGAHKSQLEAKVAGGANLFPNLNLNTVSIGEQNTKAVIKNLGDFNIPIVGQDILGNYGRKMRFFIDSGIVLVTAIGKKPMEI